jgi:heme/copper-type cytochrome/quinol oxidase subunit 2
MVRFGVIYILGVVTAVLALALLSSRRRRRRQGEPFDWSHRRRWWRPRWAFPDDR